MKLLRLKLENFRQHGSSTVEFRGGMTAIVGPNGSGKTTILEAITFALYGEKRGDKNTIRFYWAPPRKPFRVELSFEFDGRQFVVERGETEAALKHIDGLKEHVLAQGLKSVTGACERLTALSYEQFTNSFCAEQKGLAFLDFKSAGARQDEIARMLGYDRLKLAAGIGKDRVRDLRNRINGLRENLGNETELKAQIATATASLKSAAEAVKSAETRLASLDKELPTAQKARETAERFLELTQKAQAIAATAEGLKTTAKVTEEALESARLDAKALSRLRPIEKEFQETEALAKTFETQREVHLAREAKFKRLEEVKLEQKAAAGRVKALGSGVCSDLEGKLVSANAALGASQKTLTTATESWREDQANAKAELARVEERLKEAEAQVKRAEDLIARGICPECGQSTQQSGAEALASRRSELEARGIDHGKLGTKLQLAATKPKAVVDAEAAVTEHQASVDSARRLLTEGQALAAKIAAETETIKRLEYSSAILEKEIAATVSTYDVRAHQAAKAKCEALKSEHAAYLRVEQADVRVEQCLKKHEASRTELETAKATYRKLDEERKRLGLPDAEAARKAVQAHSDLASERRVVEKELTNAVERQQDFTTRLTDADLRLAELRKREEAIRTAGDELALVDFTAKELLNLRERLNETIRPDIEARASDNLALLTHDRYSVLKLDEDFQATLVEDDIEKPVISGGEEDVVALALRLALSELIQERQGRPMSLLILDEVFGSLDSVRRQSVLDRLASIKGRFAQILVISHIEEINQVADQCLYVSRDSDSRSARVTDAPPEFELMAV